MSENFVSHHKPIGVLKTFAALNSFLWHKVRNVVGRNTACDRINAFVKQKTKEGDVTEILQAVDTYCREKEWIIHLGRHKAETFTTIVQECNPVICLELGTYCGYSAILLASMLSTDAKIYTVEYDASFVKPAEELIKYAGLQDKITVIHGDAGEVIPALRETYSVDKLDFVFIDHHKPLYCRELKLLEAGKYLRNGTVVVADDLGWPGSPEYDEYVQKSQNFESSFFDTKIDMMNISDVMGKSVYKG